MFQKQAAKAKINQISKLTEQLPREKALCLRYLLNLADLLSEYILPVLRTNPSLIKPEELKTFYATLFQRFTVYEFKGQSRALSKL